MSVTSKRDATPEADPLLGGGQVASSEPSNGGRLFVTNHGLPAFGTLITAAEARAILVEQFGEEPELRDVIQLVDLIERGPGPRPGSIRRRRRRHASRRWVAAHEPRPCRECGDTFDPADARQVFCSPKCRKRYGYRESKRDVKRQPAPTYRGGHVATNELNNHGGLLVTNRGFGPLKCGRCSEPFKPKRTDQQFCSNKCRQAAYRDRQREAPAS